MDRSDRAKWQVGLRTGLIGTLVAVVFGLLTFGVQATAAPRGVPLAVAVPEGSAGQALAPVAARLAEQGGETVEWRVVNPGRAAELLDGAEVYGVLELAQAPGGPAITTTTSGAVNPSGTAVAEQVLARASEALSPLLAQQAGVAPTVTAEVVHETAPAARSLPLSAASLLWLASLAANAALLVMARLAGRGYPEDAGLAATAVVAVAVPAVVYGFTQLWGAGVDWSWGAVGFLALTGLAFSALAGGLMRWLGVRGIAVMALLFLTAPAVAGQVAELLHPAYRTLLWSWTPIRFAADALRSLFFSGGVAPAVTTGVWIFAGLTVAGLVALTWPSRRRLGEPEPVVDRTTVAHLTEPVPATSTPPASPPPQGPPATAAPAAPTGRPPFLASTAHFAGLAGTILLVPLYLLDIVDVEWSMFVYLVLLYGLGALLATVLLKRPPEPPRPRDPVDGLPDRNEALR